MHKQVDRGWLSALALVFLALATTASAKTLQVRPDGQGGFATIAAALEAADSGDTILLEQGVYSGRGNQDITFEGKAVTLTSRDPNNPTVVANTVIDCQGQTRMAIHYAADTEAEGGTRLILAGLTIRNAADISAGGAVWWEDADLEVINCTFQNNRIDFSGGAVYCRNSRARFVGCTFTDNTSDTLQGGAIYGTGSRIDVVKCSFRANRGSALQSYDCQVTVTQCDFEGNKGQDGGAIYSRADADPESTSLAVSRCTFTDNTAGGSGGALYNYGLRATIDACTFQTNKAEEDGGAIYNYRAGPAISSCLFVGNTATGAGGAIQNLYNSSPDLIHCTFVANEAPRGGAVAALGGSNPLLSHSILWNNTGAQGRSLYLGRYPWSSVPTATATIEYCDLEDERDGTFADSGCDIRWGSGNLAADPLFIAPSRSDYHLSADSPCIDAGDPKYLPETGKIDLDGRLRLLGEAVDIGVYECPGLGPVYRFWSPTKSKHFYTMNARERDKLVTRYKGVWQLEGEAYYAFYQPVEENLLPVYRFWDPKADTHFWTISEEERANTIKNYPGVWVPEGVAFYAYAEGRQPLGTLPVYRFWSNRLGYYFYTISENEKNKLVRNYSQIWKLEGVAWYAYDKSRLPDNTIYTFTGGPEEASYILTLGAAIDGKEVSLATPEVRLSTSSTWMQMAIDFDRSSAMLNRLHIQTAVTDYKATLPLGGTSAALPMTLSVEALLDVSTSLGPFFVNPSTGVFADLSKPNPNLVTKDPIAKCTGSIRLGGQEKTFTIEGVATRFETEATGAFESLNLLPDQIVASMPYTFQWHRQFVKDILADTSVDGHRVQVYVTSIYVGTQGRWKGQLAR
jgi:predicted outer membrane repeat protein